MLCIDQKDVDMNNCSYRVSVTAIEVILRHGIDEALLGCIQLLDEHFARIGALHAVHTVVAEVEVGSADQCGDFVEIENCFQQVDMFLGGRHNLA